MNQVRTYPLDQALRALAALRAAAGLAPELFPIQAFVGMISDEVESLHKQGVSDAQIADIIQRNSAIQITGDEIAEHYARPEERRRHGE